MIQTKSSDLRIASVFLVLFFVSCQSVKENTYYEDRLSKERVPVVFAGTQEALIKRYGQKFKYLYDLNDSPFVVFTSTLNYNPYSSNLKIIAEKSFLKQFALLR